MSQLETNFIKDANVTYAKLAANVISAFTPLWYAQAYTNSFAFGSYTYANGTAGVGATLTANSNGAFPAVDGITLSANQYVLINNTTASPNSGLYQLTTVGSGGTAAVLTRATNMNGASTFVEGGSVAIITGTVYGGAVFVLNTVVTTVGTTNVTFQLMTPIQAVDVFTLNSTDVNTNKYVVLANTPRYASQVLFRVAGQGSQFYTTDYTMATATHLSWSALGLDGELIVGDIVEARYLLSN